jgi:hypothetical protein
VIASVFTEQQRSVQRSRHGCGSAGASPWDVETVVIRELRGVLGLSEERSWFEVFSSEKAGCPFRPSETQLFADFEAFYHPSFALPATTAPCKLDDPQIANRGEL